MAKKLNKAADTEQVARAADYQILLRPVVTEKSARAGGAGNRLVFRVRREASKDEIRRAVESVFKVKVVSVNTVNYLGKVKRTTGAIGRRSAYKKAYVTLQEGQSIQVVEGL